MQKRILAVHDISCIGKCSLTVALPILSAAGLETSVLPTAILSTHTGGFEDFTYLDMTDNIEPVLAHWKSLGIKIDAIYTGYLGSIHQIELVNKLLDMFSHEDTFIMVDPVMADNGEFYSKFTHDFAKSMKKLCKRADIIVPNLTEAALLLDEPYIGHGYTEEYIDKTLMRLTELGCDTAVLSGVSLSEGKLGAAAYSKKTGEITKYFADEIHGFFPGTGDVFASALLAAIMNGANLEKALKITVDFTTSSISRTKKAGTDKRYGVDFEHSIPSLVKEIMDLPLYER